MSLDENWELFEPSLTPLEKRLREASSILKRLGFDEQQYNITACYTLLAMLELAPGTAWADAQAPLLGTTPIMKAIHRLYGFEYKPNSREGIRDDAIKYFVEHGIVLRNPDMPGRPTTGKVVYQVEPNALALFRSFRTPEWQGRLEEYLSRIEAIRHEIKRHRVSHRILIHMPDGSDQTLSPGGQNPLIKQIVEQFRARFAPDGSILYLGDSESKFKYFATDKLEALGIRLAASAKIPDVVIHCHGPNWLLLIEAVTSTGTVDGKRRKELKELFKGSKAGLVFVTAFPDMKTMRKYLPKIAWETEVWIAEDPEHLIHFNGERFLGPYPDVMP